MSSKENLQDLQQRIRELEQEVDVLQRKESLLHDVYDEGEIATFIVKVNGLNDYEYESVNRQHEKVFGQPVDKLKGKSPADLESVFGKEAIEYVYSIYNECVSSKTTHISEFEVSVDDSKGWWIIRVTPMINENGEVYRLIGTALSNTDIRLAKEEHVRTEEQLLKSRKFFKGIIESSPLAIDTFRLEDDDCLLLVAINPAAEQKLGLKSSEILGKQLEEIYPSLVGTELPDLYRSVARGDLETQTFERHFKEDLFEGWFQLTVHQISEKLVSVQTIDISQRRENEEKLRANELLLRTMAENYPNSYVSIIEKDLTIGYTAGQEFLNQNLDPNQFVGLRLDQIFGEQSDFMKEKYLKTFEGSGEKFEIFINDQYQSYKTVPLYNHDGQINRIMVVAENITESKSVEKALLESEKKFKFLTDTSPLAIYMSTGLEQKAEYINPTFTKLFGYKMDEVPSIAKWWPLAYPDPQYRKQIEDEWQSKVENAIDTKSDIEPMETVVTCKDGSKRDISWGFKASGEQNWAFGLDITERKRAEKALREAKELIEESEEKYRALYENAPLSYQSLNESGQFIDVNPTWLTLLGYDRDEVIGKSFSDFLHPDWKPHFEKNFPAFKKIGYVHDVQFRIKHKSGHYLDISFEGCIGYNPDGSFKQTYCVFQDITDRKKTELQLQRSNSLLTSIIESPKNIIMFALDTSFNYLNFNQAHIDTMKLVYGADIKIGEHILSYMPVEDDRLKATKNYKRALSGERFVEVQEYGEEGARYWYELIFNPIYGKSNEVTGLTVFTQDITERRQAEMAAMKSKEQLNQTAKLAHVGGWEIDLVGNTLGWTEETYRIHELAEDQKPDVEEAIHYYHPDDQKMVADAVQRSIEKGEKFEFEARLITAKKNRKWVRAIGDKVTQQGQDIGVLGMIQDITDRKLAEDELRKHRDHLEELVAERTTILQEQNLELTKQRKKVEEANRLKSEFLTNMSHELRTPLNSIISLSGVLAREAKDRLSDEENHFIEIVERNGSDLLRLINDILDLSKIESGESEVNLGKVSLPQILSTITENLRIQAEEKGIKMTLEVPAKLPKVASDESKLYQVFTNIIGNAVKFTEVGSINVMVSKNTKTVYVEIKDTGIGISEDLQPHIFDEFRQADGSFSRKYEGTGLGLAIAYKAMKTLGGQITVRSTFGVGSVFKVAIPIKWTGDVMVLTEEKTTGPTSTKKSKTQTKKRIHDILVVEDNPDNMVTIKAILKGKFNILESNEGKDGLKQAVEKLPDLILLDMILPEMAGTEVVKKLKSNKRTRGIPVIALSASVMKHNKQSFIKAGCDDFVAKPIDRDILFETMYKWLE